MELFYLLSNQLIFNPNFSCEQLKLLINYQIYFCSIYNDKLFFIFWILYLNILNNNFFYSKLDDINYIFQQLYISKPKNKTYFNCLIQLITMYYVIFNYQPFLNISYLIEYESRSYYNIINFIKCGNIDFYIQQIINQDIRLNYSKNISDQNFIQLFEESIILISDELINFINTQRLKPITKQTYHTLILERIYNFNLVLQNQKYNVNHHYLHPNCLYFNILLKPELDNSLFISKYFSNYLGILYLKSKIIQRYQYINFHLEINCWKYFLNILDGESSLFPNFNNEFDLISQEIKIFFGLSNLKSYFTHFNANSIINSLENKFNFFSNQKKFIKKKIFNSNLEKESFYLLKNDLDYDNLFYQLFTNNNENNDIYVNFDKYIQLIQYLLGHSKQNIILYPIWNDIVNQKLNLIPIIFNYIDNGTYIIWKKKLNNNDFEIISKDYELLLLDVPLDYDIQINLITKDILNQYNKVSHIINKKQHNLKLNKINNIFRDYNYTNSLVLMNNNIIDYKNNNQLTYKFISINYLYNFTLIFINLCYQQICYLFNKILIYIIEILNY